MMLSRIVKLSALLCLLMPLAAQSGWDPDKEGKKLNDAEQTIKKFKAKDPSLKRFFDAAEGWAVYPTIGKGGWVVGGAYGEGVVYQKGEVIGFTDVKQVSVGLQFGGQAYSELIFFRDEQALQRFKSEKLEFDAQVSAVVADRGAAANADYHAGVAIFTLTKGGLMAEASVGGQSFSFSPKK